MTLAADLAVTECNVLRPLGELARSRNVVDGFSHHIVSGVRYNRCMTHEQLRGKEDREMTHVHVADHHELVARRERILRDHGLSFEEFADRARSYTLIGEQWVAWNELQDIAYLLGDDDS
jgi:hypothetical protein